MSKSVESIQFRLGQLKTLQYATIDPGGPEGGKINFSAGLAFGADSRTKTLVCICNYTANVEEKPFIILEVSVEFPVEENSWMEIVNDGKITLSAEFARHLGVITVGSARGVLHAKTENTLFNQYPIPLLNLFNILKEDIQIKL
mgnify:CR=1 FL=1